MSFPSDSDEEESVFFREEDEIDSFIPFFRAVDDDDDEEDDEDLTEQNEISDDEVSSQHKQSNSHQQQSNNVSGSSHQQPSHTVSGDGSSSSSISNSSFSMSVRVGQKKCYPDFVNGVRPDVAEEFKPNHLMRFRTVDEAFEMYDSYAQMAGFSARKYTERKNGDKLIHKFFVCHRTGKAPQKSVDMNNKRDTCYRVTDCLAKVVVKPVKNSSDFCFDKFEEIHNHEMMDSYHLKKSRKLSYTDKEYIVRASTVKIGAARAHKLRTTFKGGFEYVRGKAIDYKNFKRDFGSLLGSKDAQLLINKLTERKENYPNYSFYCRLDEKKALNALFWADETEKAYYSEFGDVMSFDATFRTNKYGLVFVPFTVIDHHKSSVTVGAGLLSNEDVDSYKWLLEHFLQAHGNKHPVLVLTDQDASLKQAVEVVFSNSKHRLCMWHIMKKLPKKVGKEFYETSLFQKKFKKLVWDMDMRPDVFEQKWDILIEDFDAKQKNWFLQIYNVRDKWVPAYFHDYALCGLMKTTSRSESINSFFNSYSQGCNFLLNFMMNYDNAIRRLRYKQRELDNDTKGAQFLMKSPRDIEKYAAAVYTKKVFLEVQKLMFKGCWYCDIIAFSEGEGWELYTINQKKKTHVYKSTHKVKVKLPNLEIECSCEHFNRFGILCRHAWKILLNKDVKEIPEHYLLRRWRRDVIYANYQLSRDGFDDRDAEVTKLVSDAYFNFESCLDLVRDNKEKLASFVEQTQVMLKNAKGESSSDVSSSNVHVIEKLIGVAIPDEVEIQVPDFHNTKGGRNKRLISEEERAILKSRRGSRLCSGCGKYDPHNIRTCPVKLAKDAAKKAAAQEAAARKGAKKKK